ncbi:MAG: ATP-dependent DNA helicase RecG [Ruminococcaceae bacterium]|nr:ATP-dependent DNA helicase RecG [Oscillospiraceae bacterium]
MDRHNAKQIEYLNSPITILKGIGSKKASLYSKLGITTIWDLVYYFPSGYEDRRIVRRINECQIGEMCCIKIRPLRQIVERRLKPKLSLFLLYGTDGFENVTIKWFSAPYAKPTIKSGHIYTIYGALTSQNGKKEFDMHYIEDSAEKKYTECIVPTYHATSGLTTKTICETVSVALDSLEILSECIPDHILKKYNLVPVLDAVKKMHRPESFEDLKNARDRLAFEELFVLTLALSSVKGRRKEKKGVIIKAADNIREFAKRLPFELTDGQKETINDICRDLKNGIPMNRLVQGDVGCGKTVVAAAVMYACSKSGYQSAFMAPTEILAQQHYKTLKNLFGDEVRIALYTSSVKGKNKISEDISQGVYDIIVGTHALIENNVKFSNLALCITDEQHRFGVNQRALLGAKGESPHILVMSATPIPRTLSLILYGDLDISVIKSMPKGRQKILTYHIDEKTKNRAYGFLKTEVEKKHQCYIVCPLVEDSETIDASSVESMISSLKNGVYSDLRVGYVHGKMKSDEKDTVMNSFKSGELDILISTTVIEVGVDVPNATVMLIENAERFGLSQLHQLRGRVGRGDEQSYCILVSDCKTENCRERMKIMTQTDDGFVIAQKDMELRGSGQFFGTRQHGVPELKIANLFSDAHILQKAVESANEIILNDPELSSYEMVDIKNRIRDLFDKFDGNDIFN